MNFDSPMNFESTKRKANKAEARRAKKRRRYQERRNSRKRSADYQQLEARNLLAVEIGLNFTGAIGGTDSVAEAPDTQGAVGPDHIVEMINSRVAVFDKSGTLIEEEPLGDFWLNAGANVTSPQFSPQIVFDPIEQRWFASAIDDGIGNEIFVGVSETEDPTGTWRSVQFVGDLDGLTFNDDDVLGVDANGVYITTRNSARDDVSIYSIPKRDLLGESPSTLRMTRFENLDALAYGQSLQVANDYDINPRGVVLGVFEGGSTFIARTDIVGPSGPGAGLSTPANIDVPFYEAAPDGRQPDMVPLMNDTPEFTGNVVRNNGFVYAAHSVLGSDNNAAIRWYKIELSSNTLADWGTIEDTELDFTHPSIAVNDFGAITIGFTATGPDQFASAAAVNGYTVNGLQDPVIVFGEPSILRDGQDNLTIGINNNPWGQTSATQVDPVDPFSFWTFQQFANGSNNWSVRISETGLFDLTPTVRADDTANDIVIRTSPTNSEWVEVEIDGTVTDIFERRSLTSLNIDAAGGDDTILVDLSFGLPLPFSGITARGGDGLDMFEVSGGSVGQNWIVNGDGSGVVDGEIRFQNFEEIQAGDNDDSIEVRETGTDLLVQAGAGNDFLFVTDTIVGQLTLRGEAGNDQYRLPIESITSIIVEDTVGSEDDILTAFATPDADEIDLSNSTIRLNGATTADFVADGVELIEIDGLGGSDTFNVLSINAPTTFLGSAGNDVFNFNSDAPGLTGNNDNLNAPISIDGGAGNNQIVISALGGDVKSAVISQDTISGMTPIDISYTATNGSFGVNNTDGILLIGSDAGADQFEITSLLVDNTIRIQGSQGDDVFIVRGDVAGNVDLDGETGSDTYRVAIEGSVNREVLISDSGTHPNLGTTDRVTALLTDADDAFQVQNGVLSVLSETLQVDNSIESLVINALGGDDTAVVFANDVNNVRVIGGAGNDTFNIEGTRNINGLRLEGSDGVDNFNLNESVAGTFIVGFGGRGDDSFSISNSSFASGRIDGQDGGDDILVNLVGRTSRVLNLRDTGAAGDDRLTVAGTGGIDRYFIRQQNITNFVERVLYNGNTEFLSANTGNSNDIVTFFGSLAGETVVNTGQGNDLIIVNNTSGADSLLINSGDGDDQYTVRSTWSGSNVILRGELGNDTFRVGSSAADDNGNLGRIRGRITVNGGEAPVEDRLLVNDRSGNGEFDYFVSDNQVANLNGANSPSRDNFAGIFSSGLEFVRVDGTDMENRFNVRPSQATRFYIDGNLPEQQTGQLGDLLNVLGDATDGRSLRTTGEGSGVWTFTDGSHEIRFENIENNTIVRNSRSSSMMAESSAGRSNMGLASTNSGLSGAQELSENNSTGRPFESFVDSVFADHDDEFDVI